LGTNPKGSYASVAARLAASTGSITTWRKAASGGETSLTGTDDFSTTLAYTVGQEQVFINGVLLERGVDYTATTGSSITGLTALVASDIATVISVGTFNVANAIPLSQFTAKGDILVGTGASTEAALNIGADGTTLVANSAASTGVSWATPVASLANPIINGGFDIAQRGTSISVAASSNTYTLDRWLALTYANEAATISRQATGDTTNLPNIQYCARVQRNSGQTGTTEFYLVQGIETANFLPFVGKTFTLSWYARAGSNYSPTSSLMTYYVETGTGTDQNPASAYTGQVELVTGSKTISTTWQRFTATGTFPTSATEVKISFGMAPTGTALAADYFEVTGVQIDLGTYTATTAPTFRRSASTLQGELAACQRYYYRVQSSSAYNGWGVGYGINSTGVSILAPLPVTMRAIPTVLDYSQLAAYDGAAVANASAAVINAGQSGNNAVTVTLTSTSITQYRPTFGIFYNNSAGYIGFGAEL
jgi:hypothetical protein